MQISARAQLMECSSGPSYHSRNQMVKTVEGTDLCAPLCGMCNRFGETHFESLRFRRRQHDVTVIDVSLSLKCFSCILPHCGFRETHSMAWQCKLTRLCTS